MEENNYIKLITESKKKRIVKAKDLNNPFFSCYGRMGQIVVLRIVGYFHFSICKEQITTVKDTNNENLQQGFMDAEEN